MEGTRNGGEPEEPGKKSHGRRDIRVMREEMHPAEHPGPVMDGVLAADER
jgi:hypothetical protein